MAIAGNNAWGAARAALLDNHQCAPLRCEEQFEEPEALTDGLSAQTPTGPQGPLWMSGDVCAFKFPGERFVGMGKRL